MAPSVSLTSAAAADVLEGLFATREKRRREEASRPEAKPAKDQPSDLIQQSAKVR